MPKFRKLFSKTLPVIFFGTFFTLVLILITPPLSWDQASVFQILIFFLPLLFLFTFFINIFLNFFPRSFIISLGVIVILVLQAINILNILTFILVTSITGFTVWKYQPSYLTIPTRIPRLSRFRRKHG